MNDFYGEVFFCTSAATVDCCRLIFLGEHKLMKCAVLWIGVLRK